MDSQLGIINVWSQGDWVTRGVVMLLLVMSIASWVVILIKAADLLRFRRMAKGVDGFWYCTDYAEGISRLGTDPTSPYRLLADAGQEAALHHRHAQAHLHDSLNANDWITRCLQNSISDSVAKLQAGLAILASVGSTAPFVGLFGTVWGIYHALMGISVAGQATIDKVAGPIGEALIMTALGLAVAIPAVLGYNALVRANKAIASGLNRFGHDLHAYFLTGARVGSDEQGKVIPMKQA